MKHIITFTLLFIASLCAAQVGEIDIDSNVELPFTLISQPLEKQQAAETIILTIEDVQDVIARDNEPLRALIRLWYVQALHTGRNDSQAVEIALDKLGKFLLERINSQSKKQGHANYLQN